MLIAALLRLAAALTAPSVLLAFNKALYPPQLIAVTAIPKPLQLVPNDNSMLPFSHSQATEFWTERGALAGSQITVRQGMFSVWQYDSEPLGEEVWAFYKTYNGSARLPEK